jgi:hypothetical protein
MKNLLLFLLIIVTLVQVAHAQQQADTSEFADVEKLCKLYKGLSEYDLPFILGTDPVAEFKNEDKSATVQVYIYMLRNRVVDYLEIQPSKTTNESSQTAGYQVYVNPGRVYILIRNHKVVAFTTDHREKRSGYLLITENNIAIVPENQWKVVRRMYKEKLSE